MAVKPKLALIPSGVKASKVYSVLPSNGTGDFDFSRSGSSTRINKDGLIETVDSNIPRLNYPLIDGVVSGCPSLLLEPTSTNVITHSEDFSNASWVKNNCTILSNQDVAPNGTLTADLMTLTDTNGSIDITGFSSGVIRTQSIYVKSFNNQSVTVQMDYSGLDIIRLETTNSWTRISTVGTNTNFSNRFRLRIVGEANSSVLIWGAQLEQQSYATSYIPTSGSIATRSAETCNNAGDVNTFNDSEGVLMAEISALADDGTFRAISLSSGSPTQSIRIFYRNDINKIQFYLQTNNESSYQGSVSSATDFNKLAIKYKENDTDIYINGFLVHTMTSVDTPIGLSQLDFYNNNTQPFYGNTKQIQYFDTALTDTDLEELTSWTSFNEMAESQQYTIL